MAADPTIEKEQYNLTRMRLFMIIEEIEKVERVGYGGRRRVDDL